MISDTEDEATMCVVCGKNEGATKKCSRCKGIQYCSRECQAEDWPRHKLLCCSVEEQKEMKDHVERDRKIFKQVKKGIKHDVAAEREKAIALCSSETAFGYVVPGMPLPSGVPPNFALKQEATLHYLQGPSSKGGLGSMRGEQHFRAYYDDLVDETQKEAWRKFFVHPENESCHVAQTVGILGTLATIYRQRGGIDEECEKILDLGKELIAILERNALAQKDPILIRHAQDFRFRHQHVRYNLYYQQKRYNENVKLYRELMDYEISQPNTPWKDTMYLKMVTHLLHKKATAQVLQLLTDEEVMEMVMYPAQVGLPKEFEESKKRVALNACASCSVPEKAIGQYQACSRCQQVCYCSRGCQQAHWKAHKKACKAASKKHVGK